MRFLRVLALLLVLCAVLGVGRGRAQTPDDIPSGSPGTSGSASAASDKPGVEPAKVAPVQAGAQGQAARAHDKPAASGQNASAAMAAAPPPADNASAGSASAATSPPNSAAGSTDDLALDGASYVVRMRDLAQRVDELKEQIRRSHTRLSLLSDTILSGGGGGARADIRFGNELSSAFRLTRLLIVLDGAVQYNRQDDTGSLAKQREIPIFSGSIPPGDHTLQVLVKLQGYGYGVFSYLRGYHFEYKSSTSFTVTAGKTIELRAIATEKGSVTTPLEERPSMRFVQNVRDTGSADESRTRGAGGGLSSGAKKK